MIVGISLDIFLRNFKTLRNFVLLDQYNIITKEPRYLVLFQDWPFFENNYFWFCLEKSLCNQYIILYLALLFLVNAKKENIKKKVVSFIMAKLVNIEVILLKSLRHLLKKPDTII